jgi:exportin-1
MLVALILIALLPQTALKVAQEEKRKVQMAVPGILNPHEVGEEMQD